MLFGYWALSNQQLFFGVAEPHTFANDKTNPMHSYFDLEHGFNIAYIMLILLGVFLLCKLIEHFYMKKKKLKQTKIETIRNLSGNYLKKLASDTQKGVYINEVYFQQKLEI